MKGVCTLNASLLLPQMMKTMQARSLVEPRIAAGTSVTRIHGGTQIQTTQDRQKPLAVLGRLAGASHLLLHGQASPAATLGHIPILVIGIGPSRDPARQTHITNTSVPFNKMNGLAKAM